MTDEEMVHHVAAITDSLDGLELGDAMNVLTGAVCTTIKGLGLPLPQEQATTEFFCFALCRAMNGEAERFPHPKGQ
jgi:hypothetical protein